MTVPPFPLRRLVDYLLKSRWGSDSTARPALSMEARCPISPSSATSRPSTTDSEPSPLDSAVPSRPSEIASGSRSERSLRFDLLSCWNFGLLATERSVLAIMLDSQSGGESILASMKFTLLLIAKVFVMCFMGFLMTSKYVNILSASGRKLLNGLVFSLLLSCLIFSQLGRVITLQKLLEWWYIPVNVVIGTVSSSLIGLIIASIIRPPYPCFKFTIIHIRMVLIAALCRDESNPFGDSAKCSQDGNAYIFVWLVQLFCTHTCFRCLLHHQEEPSMALNKSSFQLTLPIVLMFLNK